MKFDKVFSFISHINQSVVFLFILSMLLLVVFGVGSGAVEILNGFDYLISSDAVNDSTLSVIYQNGDQVISAQYSLKTLKPISSTVITDLLALNPHG